MINSIRGLWAQVKYPLGFTKNGLKADSSCVLFGAGNTGTGGNIGGSETTTVVNAGFIKYYFESLAASGTNVGLYINAIKGAGAGMTALKIAVSGGAVALDLSGGGLTVGSSGTPVTVTSTGTTNLLDIEGAFSAASGITRGILSNLVYSGTNAGVALNAYAIRGYTKVTGTITGGSTVYVAGTQGKVELAGTMTGGRAVGVLAQIAAKGAGTVTGGEIAGLWIDNQFGAAVGGGNTLDAIHIESSDALIALDSFLKVYGKATAFLSFEGAYSDYLTADATAFSGLTASFKIKVMVGATPAYIHMTTA